MTETREGSRTRRAPGRPLHHVYFPMSSFQRYRRCCDGELLTAREAVAEARASGCPNCTVCAVCAEIAGSHGNPHRGAPAQEKLP